MEVWEKTVLIICSAILVIFLIVIIFRDHGLVQLTVREEKMLKAKARNAEVKTENDKLLREINRLKSDRDYIESVARKELGMIKEDEIIIKFHSRNTAERTND